MHSEQILTDCTPKPTFFLLGAAKSGTTSLFHSLAKHPEVFFSKPKEPIFFEAQYGRGIEYYSENYLQGWSGEPAIGDGRVYNLYLPYVACRIRASVPEARLIAILRNPVDRAYSHWWHRVTRGYERRSFPEAINDELPRLEQGERFALRESEALWKTNLYSTDPAARTLDVREVPYIEMGYYAEQISRYRNLFPESQMQVYLLDDLKRRPDWLLQQICEFLGLNGCVPPAKERKNVARDEVKGRLAFAIERLGWFAGITKLVPKRLRSSLLDVLPKAHATRPRMDPKTRSLLHAHYHAPNEELSRLVDGDWAMWDGSES